jgi:cobalamin biosynthesis Mg chelatase CobN
MKAMVVLALLFLPLVVHADVILEDTKPSRPPHKKPVKPHKTVTSPSAATSTTATTATAATTTAETTTAATSTTTTTTTVAPATQTEAPPAAPAPERRKSQFPFAAITTIGIALIVALAANRQRARKTP